MTEANRNTLRSVIVLTTALLSLLGLQLLFNNFIGSMAWAYVAIFLIVFFMVEGFNEAVTDDFKQRSNGVYNGHAMFRINTTIVLLLAYNLTNWQDVICYISMYMFLHDGMYYWKRSDLAAGVYPKGFFDFTKAPIAWTDKIGVAKPYARLTLFIAGIVGLIIFNYVNK